MGVEFDKTACATRAAAGLHTTQSDIRDLNPSNFWANGLIASPPCQTFSQAGKGAGRQHIDALIEFIATMKNSYRPAPDDAPWDAVKTGLVLEPLRWADAIVPKWIALEQVRAVLPIWEATAHVLEAWGYHTWTGILSAEQYGVPQTRQRAILMAHLVRDVAAPAPTHHKYQPRKKNPDDLHLPRWISMAEALGWGATERPSWVVPSHHDGGGADGYGGSGARNAAHAARRSGGWVEKPDWVFNRPSTTIVGSFRPDLVAPPTWRKPGDGPRQNQPGAVAISVEDALVLQSFARDYPVQGGKTAQFLQVGNAIPPLLATAILRELV